jgi:hypothetical protein
MALLARGIASWSLPAGGAVSALTRREPAGGAPRSGALAVRLGPGDRAWLAGGSPVAVISVTVRAWRAGGGWERDPRQL